DAELVAKLLRAIVKLLAGLGLEHHLGEARAVAQVDEDGAAVVAAVVHPAEEDHLLAHVLRGQFATGVGALQLADEFGHGRFLSRRAAPVSTNRLLPRAWR